MGDRCPAHRAEAMRRRKAHRGEPQAGCMERLARNFSHSARAERIAASHPVALSANSVQTKKKPPDLETTRPFEWPTIMAAANSPPSSMMTYPHTRSDNNRVPQSQTTKMRTARGYLFAPS